MPRPTLIIGVGGTGHDVLAWVKKNLSENYGTMQNIPVRILLLDVALPLAKVGGLQTVGGTQSAGGKAEPLDVYKASTAFSEFASTSDDEFLRLPDNGTGQAERNIVEAVRSDEAVRNGQKPGGIQMQHFEWLRINHFGAAVPNLYEGAGKFRQLGRLSLLQGLNQGGNDRVYQRIRALIDQIASQSPVHSLDVHIIGSFAGGTGSGLFLDVAWLVRKAAEDKTGNPAGVFVTGFFAMPDVFSAQPNREMRYKAFCAWRELNRMQTIHPEELHNGFRMVWGGDESVIYDVRQPAYDHVYLVDANREGAPFNREMIVPIMAEAITFFADDKMGTQYIQHITANLRKRKQDADYHGRPTFSTFFVKAWKLPAQHRALMFQHKVAVRYLELLLGIEQTEFINQATNMQVARYTLSDQANCGPRGGEILNGNLSQTGNTMFIESLGDLHRRAMEAYKRDGEIRGAAAIDTNLLTTYVQLPNNEGGQRAAALIDENTGFAVPEYSTEFPARENLESVYKMLHGVDGRTGKVEAIYGDFSTESVPGRLYEGLDIAHRHHMDVFKRRIVEWTRTELQTPQSGKLACVIRAIESLRDYLDDALEFMRDVLRQQPDVQQAFIETQRAYTEALVGTDNPGFFDNAMHRPRKLVIAWLDAERTNVAARRNRRAAQRMEKTITDMRRYVQETVLSQLYRVKNTLIGDNALNTTMGLYRAVLARMDQEDGRFQADLQISDVVELVADDESIPDPTSELVAPLINQSRWNVDDDMSLSVSIQIGDQPSIELRPDNVKLDELAEQLIYQIGAVVGTTASENAPAVQKMGVKRLAEQLSACQKTLFRASTLTLHETRTFYVGLQGLDTKNPRNILQDAINRLGFGSGSEAAIVDSENANKIVVFSARELLLPEQFGEWDDCYKEYNTQIIGDPGLRISPDLQSVRCDHLFIAEQRAVDLEARVRSLIQQNPDTLGKNPDGSYRYDGRQLPILNARLVHLLASQDRLRDFIKAWLLGWVTLDGDYWSLLIPTQRPIPLSSAVSEDILSMLSAYVSDQTWVGAAFNYQTVQTRLTEAWQKELTANPQRLQDRCKREQDLCRLIGVLHSELMLLTPGLTNAHRAQVEAYLPLARPLPQHILDAKLEQLYASLGWSEDWVSEYRREVEIGRAALAHECCRDFKIVVGEDQPLVNNVTAHEQAVEFLLYFLFGDLQTELRGRLVRR